MILFISSLYFHKYLEKHLSSRTLRNLRKVSIVLILLCLILTYLTLFTNFTFFSFSKEGLTWNAELLNYKELHKYTTGKSQKIALIDSGVSVFQMQKDNKNSIVLNGDSYDENGHGTMMYSIIKGYEDKIIGVAPDVDIVSIKVLSKDEQLKP